MTEAVSTREDDVLTQRVMSLVPTLPLVAHTSRSTRMSVDCSTMYFGPPEVMLALEVKFRDELSVVGVRATVKRVQKTVRKEYPDITRIHFASESVGAEEF